MIRLIRPFRHVKIPPGAFWDLSKFLNRDHRCPASRPTTARGCTARAGPCRNVLLWGSQRCHQPSLLGREQVREVRVFSMAGKSHTSGCLAQLRAVLAGGCVLTVGTCASLCPYLSAIKLGLKHLLWLRSLGQRIQCKARDFCSLYFNEFYAF